MLILNEDNMRNLSSFIIVEEIMREVLRIKIQKCQAIEDDSFPLPCEYFDLICETSIGGLIVIMLERFRIMSIN